MLDQLQTSYGSVSKEGAQSSRQDVTRAWKSTEAKSLLGEGDDPPDVVRRIYEGGVLLPCLARIKVCVPGSDPGYFLSESTLPQVCQW